MNSLVDFIMIVFVDGDEFTKRYAGDEFTSKHKKNIYCFLSDLDY